MHNVRMRKKTPERGGSDESPTEAYYRSIGQGRLNLRMPAVVIEWLHRKAEAAGLNASDFLAQVLESIGAPKTDRDVKKRKSKKEGQVS